MQACFANTTLKENAAKQLQGKSNTKDTGKVRYGTNVAGMQHDTTNDAASCKVPPPPPPIAADMPIRQEVDKHALLMQPLKTMQQGN